MKKWTISFIVIIVLLTPTLTFAKGNNIFIDTKPADWFYKPVLEMNALGVISGYEDGSFKPSNGVKKIETIAMVLRYLGLEEQAQGVSEFEKALYLPKIGLEVKDVPTWAQGYLVLGTKINGMIQQPSGVFDWNGQASRAWVAQLLIRAIGKEGDARNLQYTNTTFADNSSIAQQYLGYINAAVQNNLINGYEEDNTFRPNRVTSRAEMAVLLNRLNPYIPKKSNVETGVIQQIIGTQLSIQDEMGRLQNGLLSSNVSIFTNSNQISISDLKAKDQIRYIVKNNQIVFVDRIAQNVQANMTAAGKVMELSVESNIIIIEKEDKQLVTLTFDENSQIFINNVWTTELTKYPLTGTTVEVTYTKDAKLLSIIPKNYEAANVVQGEITQISISNRLITIQKSTGTYETFPYSDEIEIEYAGKRFSTISDLKPGDTIEIDISQNPVSKIRVLTLNQSAEVKGTVQALNETTRVLTLLVGTEYKGYAVSDQVQIQLTGLTNPKLSDLEAEDEVSVKIDKDKIVEIKVLNRSYITESKGKLVSLDKINRILTIEDANGNLIARKFADTPKVLMDGVEIDWDEVQVGYPVILYIHKDLVTTIQLDIVRYGEITSFDQDRRTIRVDLANGEETFPIARSVDIQYFGVNDPDLNDLKEGLAVKVYLNLNGEINDIDVAYSALFIVDNVNTREKQIRVIDKNNKKWYVVYTADTKFVDSADSKSTWSDLDVGDNVWLTFLGDDLIELQTEETYIGKVYRLDRVNNEVTIDIEGQYKKFALNDLRDLVTGDYTLITQIGTQVNVNKATVKSGLISYVDLPGLRIYIQEGNEYLWIDLRMDTIVQKGIQWLDLDDLKQNDSINYYTIDGKVIGIDVQ